MSCPDCDICDYSYASPTEYDPEIQINCNNCGAVWYEPNDQYVEAQKRELEENYYDRF